MDISGQHFKFDLQTKSITFFEVSGSLYNNGKQWAVSIWTDAQKTSQITMAVTKRQFSLKVIAYLAANVSAQEELAANGCLVISSRMAVALWLEGLITVDHLSAAREFPDLVVIPRLQLGRYCLNVAVRDERKVSQHFEWVC